MTTTPPAPADLDTTHAAALADDARAVFAYLATVARSAAEIATAYADDADNLADDVDPESRDQAIDYAEQARGDAARADNAADRAELAVDQAGDFGALRYAAEDVEPAALAEVAASLAESLALALERVAASARPAPRDPVPF